MSGDWLRIRKASDVLNELLGGLEVLHSHLQSTMPERYHIRPCFTLEGPEIGARTRKPLLLLIYPLWILPCSFVRIVLISHKEKDA